MQKNDASRNHNAKPAAHAKHKGAPGPRKRRSSGADAEDAVGRLLSEHPVVMFSKSYCPYCARAKQILGSLRPPVDVTVLELDQIPNGAEIQNVLVQKYLMRYAAFPPHRGPLFSPSPPLFPSSFSRCRPYHHPPHVPPPPAPLVFLSASGRGGALRFPRCGRDSPTRFGRRHFLASYLLTPSPPPFREPPPASSAPALPPPPRPPYLFLLPPSLRPPLSCFPSQPLPPPRRIR